MKTIERIIATDGGALDLATAILTIAYGLERKPGAADSLRGVLGLGDAVVHTTETAFSYPNAVALVRDERGRKAAYLYDSDQETLREGSLLAEVNPDTAEATAQLPAGAGAGPADAAPAPAAPPATPYPAGGLAADEIGTRDGTPPAAPPEPADAAALASPADAARAADEAGAAPVQAAEPDAPLVAGEPAKGLPPGVPDLPPPGDGPAIAGVADAGTVAATPPAEAQTIGTGDVGKLSDLGLGAAQIEGVGEPRPVTAADPLKPEPVILSAEDKAKLADVAIGGPDAGGTALAPGFVSGKMGEPAETQTIDAAPGIGAGGTKLDAGEGEPAKPALHAIGADPKGEGYTAALDDNAATITNPYDEGEQPDAFNAWAKGYGEGMAEKGKRPVAG